MLKNVVAGPGLLFSFLFGQRWSLLRAVERAWDSPSHPAQADGTTITQFRLRRRVISTYNQRYEQLRRTCAASSRAAASSGAPSSRRCSRFGWPAFVVAARGNARGVFFISLLQFVVAPYSFFAAVAAWLGMVPRILGHVITFAALQSGTAVYARLPGVAGYINPVLSWWMIATWIAIDQLSCLLLCFWSPIRPPTRVPWRRSAASP